MLTIQELQDIEQLQKECEAYDRLQLKLNWEMLRNRESNLLDFFQYENGELQAFLGLYAFGSTVEISGMVKPSERRNGLFNRLLQQGIEAAKQIGYKKILLNAPAESDAAKAFLSQIAAEYAFTEHQMKWQARHIEVADGVTLRLSTADDLEMRVRLSMEAFGESEEDAKEMESRFSGTEDNMFMIDANDETIGKIRVSLEDGQAWIYGFSILPEYQGKGIGRTVLQLIIQEHSSAGHSIHLDVETKNDHALGLYESVGFKVVHAQDYYKYRLDLTSV
jgi:ribosomal protein S18 acetylase RimI-like enzyme